MLIAIAVFLVAIAAFSISAVSGGGAGLIVMPLLGVILAPAQVPAALSIGTAVSSVGRIWSFFRSIRWSVVVRFVPLAIPAAWAGVWALSLMPAVYLDFFLGIFLLGNLPALLRRRPVTTAERPPISPLTLPLLGGLAGFISGFTGAVGLLFNSFYLRLGLCKQEIVATRAANDVLLHLTKIGLYASYGLMTRETLGVGGIVAVAAVISTVLVKRFINHIPERLFRFTGHAAACVAGLAMAVLAGTQVVRQDHMHAGYSATAHKTQTLLVWRDHTFAIELEKDDLEFRAARALTTTDSDMDLSAISVLHLSPRKGIYITRQLEAVRDL